MIAEEVWADKDGVGMHAKVLDALSNRLASYIDSIADEACYFRLARQDDTEGKPISISKGEGIAQIKHDSSVEGSMASS